MFISCPGYSLDCTLYSTYMLHTKCGGIAIYQTNFNIRELAEQIMLRLRICNYLTQVSTQGETSSTLAAS